VPDYAAIILTSPVARSGYVLADNLSPTLKVVSRFTVWITDVDVVQECSISG
jgi:hypothetical protein